MTHMIEFIRCLDKMEDSSMYRNLGSILSDEIARVPVVGDTVVIFDTKVNSQVYLYVKDVCLNVMYGGATVYLYHQS